MPKIEDVRKMWLRVTDELDSAQEEMKIAERKFYELQNKQNRLEQLLIKLEWQKEDLVNPDKYDSMPLLQFLFVR